jgi:(1->4)-alpha-D-glucan 1-alpha-D-glucosylmutase
MLYQALVGAWEGDGTSPEFVERIVTYAIKAAREGKQETSWTSPDENYEKVLTGFIRRLLDPEESGVFFDEFRPFVQRTNLLGRLNSISQLVLKATMPGIPDFYQGTEFWDFSLVDPDNRRPVNFEARQRRIGEVGNRQLSATDENLKLDLTHRLIGLRAQWPAIFERGKYKPLEVAGSHRDHVIAFARIDGTDAIVVAAGRHFAFPTDGGMRWPQGGWPAADLKLNGFRILGDALNDRSLLAFGTLPLGDLFGHIPAAVLQATAA